MTDFDVRATNLRAINSMTKYPSIPTYHALDPKNGGLTASVTTFGKTVIGTEKVDGTNSRIIVLPDGSYLLGSREELLYAKGDLIGNPSQGIVEALRPLADEVAQPQGDHIRIMYLELYGGKIGSAAKQYARHGEVGWRLFDVAIIDDYAEIMDWPSQRISGWREGGGQEFVAEDRLRYAAKVAGVELTPRLFAIEPEDLPTDIEKMALFLAEHAPATRVALGDTEPGRAEGIVLRTENRSTIAKARFQDYERTLKRRR